MFLLASALIFDSQDCTRDTGSGQGEVAAETADGFICGLFEVISIGTLLTKVFMAFANPFVLAQHMLGMVTKPPTFFLSHIESTGGDQCKLISLLLEERSCHGWLDQELDEEATPAHEVDGVAQASVFVVYLSPGAVQHPPVVFQLCVATLLGRPIHFLHDERAAVPAPGSDRTNAPKNLRFGQRRSLVPIPMALKTMVNVPSRMTQAAGSRMTQAAGSRMTQAAGSRMLQAAGSRASQAAGSRITRKAPKPEDGMSLSLSQPLPTEEMCEEKSCWSGESADCYVLEAPGRLRRCVPQPDSILLSGLIVRHTKPTPSACLPS